MFCTLGGQGHETENGSQIRTAKTLETYRPKKIDRAVERGGWDQISQKHILFSWIRKRKHKKLNAFPYLSHALGLARLTGVSRVAKPLNKV